MTMPIQNKITPEEREAKKEIARKQKEEKARLADESNKKYRLADIKRWQNQDFVIGYEIRLSNNPDKECDMCSQLAGKYPKSFLWSGWHDKCKCHVASILMDRDEQNNDELNELRAALRGTKYKPVKPTGFIEVLPKNFIAWYFDNVQKQLDENNFPDFVRLNIDLITSSIKFYQNIYGNNKS